MSEKSHVSLEQHLCRVCGHPFDTGALLLDKRLRKAFEPKTVTAWGLCPACQTKADEGDIALVEAKAPPSTGARLKPEAADRTGRIFHVRRTAYSQMFDTEPDPGLPMVFIDEDVGNWLAKLLAISPGQG
jgi:hypothetical protein